MGVRIPSWVSSLPNLVKLVVFNNKRLLQLPPLNQLPFLKSICLQLMAPLEYISDEDSISNVLSGSSYSKTPFFPSLSYLELWNCPNLKGWWRNSDDDDDNQLDHLLLPSFPPCLSQLKIVGCSNLTRMPLFPYLKEDLKMVRVSSKVLQQIMKMKMGATTSPSSCYFPLS